MAGETVRIGMVRLTDAAPVVLAHVTGLFRAEGVGASVLVEPSWANVADKLAWGLLDAAVLPAPLAAAMVVGLRTPATRLIVPAGISLDGNAVTLRSGLAEPVLAGGRPAPQEAARRLQDAMAGTRVRLAVVHAFSTHDLLLRRFLELGGIGPARDVEIVVVPPAEMVAALAAGRVDGFCAGAPWGAVAARDGVGRSVAVSSALWRGHPEKCLAVRADWAAARPETLQGVLRALIRAGEACEDVRGGPALAALLSGPDWVGVPAELIAASLPQAGAPGAGDEVDRSVFAAGRAGVVHADHARWFVREMARWREVPAGAAEAAAAAYRPDLHAAAAEAVGVDLGGVAAGFPD